MTPAQLDKVQQQLEEMASGNRRPLPSQPAIREDLVNLGGQLEALVQQMAGGVEGRYSEADLWAVAVLIAQIKVKELTQNGV